MKLYTEKDYADVVDENGDVVGQAPKAWKDAGLLQDGHKLKGRSGGSQPSSSTSSSPTPPADPNPVPAKSTSRADLEKYAVEHGGMSEEQAKAYSNADELHAALVDAKAKS